MLRATLPAKKPAPASPDWRDAAASLPLRRATIVTSRRRRPHEESCGFRLSVCGVVFLAAFVNPGRSALVALPGQQQNPTPTHPAAVGPPQEPVILRPQRPPGSSHFPDEPQADDRSKRQLPAFDAAKARRQAQELADLASKIPSEVDQLSKSVLPKDLNEQLKQIQKLAKQLRSEISH